MQLASSRLSCPLSTAPEDILTDMLAQTYPAWGAFGIACRDDEHPADIVQRASAAVAARLPHVVPGRMGALIAPAIVSAASLGGASLAGGRVPAPCLLIAEITSEWECSAVLAAMPASWPTGLAWTLVLPAGLTVTPNGHRILRRCKSTIN